MPIGSLSCNRMVHSTHINTKDKSVAAVAACVKITNSKVAKQSHLHEQSACKAVGKLFG